MLKKKSSFLIPLLFVSASISWASTSGVIMIAKGQVSVKDKTGKTQPAKVGTKVVEGDSVITGPDSRAKVVMQDRNVMNVNPDSELKIETYANDGETKKVELNLIKGKVRNNVEQTYDGGEKSNFIIKTPTAVAGVRGTQFVTSFDPKLKITKIITFKGAVQFSAVMPGGRPPVMVNKGQSSSSGAGASKPETPVSVPREELKKVDSDSMNSAAAKPDSGFNGGGEPSGRSTASTENADKSKSGGDPAPTAPKMITPTDVGTDMAKEVSDYRGSQLPKSGDILPPKVEPPKPRPVDVTNIIRDQAGKTKVIIVPQ